MSLVRICIPLGYLICVPGSHHPRATDRRRGQRTGAVLARGRRCGPLDAPGYDETTGRPRRHPAPPQHDRALPAPRRHPAGSRAVRDRQPGAGALHVRLCSRRLEGRPFRDRSRAALAGRATVAPADARPSRRRRDPQRTPSPRLALWVDDQRSSSRRRDRLGGAQLLQHLRGRRRRARTLTGSCRAHAATAAGGALTAEPRRHSRSSCSPAVAADTELGPPALRLRRAAADRLRDDRRLGLDRLPVLSRGRRRATRWSSRHPRAAVHPGRSRPVRRIEDPMAARSSRSSSSLVTTMHRADALLRRRRTRRAARPLASSPRRRATLTGRAPRCRHGCDDRRLVAVIDASRQA